MAADGGSRTEADRTARRKARLGEELRANLIRRKAQAKARLKPDAGATAIDGHEADGQKKPTGK